MDERQLNLCCDKCWHTPAKPCPELLTCLTGVPQCHDDPMCAEHNQEAGAALRRDTLTRPVIFIGAGTCGLAAGAGATLKAIEKYVQDHNTEVDIVETGCVGLCSAEPIVDIQLPHRPRLRKSAILLNSAA